nr:MAG TPA: hypothetical protein [Bacteriophage sp.]
MKNAKLIIDGKEIEVTISEETLEKLTNKRTTGYERVRYGSTYYTDSYGVVATFEESAGDSKFNEEVYKSGNYYSDPDVAANNIRADNLMRQLRRFAVENRKSDIDWTNENQDKYRLYYDYLDEEFFIDSNKSYRDFGQIYFDTEEIAQQAIKIFKNELLWYFTEYRDSL